MIKSLIKMRISAKNVAKTAIFTDIVYAVPV